jgi:hypothetical protein
MLNMLGLDRVGGCEYDIWRFLIHTAVPMLQHNHEKSLV